MKIRRGALYLTDLSPRLGTEPGTVRPVVVIQTDLLNEADHPSNLGAAPYVARGSLTARSASGASLGSPRAARDRGQVGDAPRLDSGDVVVAGGGDETTVDTTALSRARSC